VTEDRAGGRRWLGAGGLHLLAWAASLSGALALCGARPSVAAAIALGALFLLIKGGTAALFGAFPEWRRSGAGDLALLVGVTAGQSALAAGILAVAPADGVSPIVAPVDGAIALGALLALGLAPRRAREEPNQNMKPLKGPSAPPSFGGAPYSSLSRLDDLEELLRDEQLLQRKPSPVDEEAIEAQVKGRRVLVTGAGGSIGSELARQLLRYAPSALVLAERSENALFLIERDLVERAPDLAIAARVVDVRDEAAVARLFSVERPEIVFHAAAHKHVPMMERHPSEAVLNNVLGTRTVGDAAHRAGCRAFVFISTDKAVNPTSVMGATKRLGELYVQAMARRSRTRFVAVRFGNVIGSSGSVLPIFVEQIKRGGPLTVTHPEMRRYFMSIPEACRLVLQAAALGEGGEVFVLDMGQPVRIVEVAERLIRCAGLEPGRDVEIVFTGPRPGEKLFEQLTLADEDATQTRHPGIWIGKLDDVDWARFADQLSMLFDLAQRGADTRVVHTLAGIIPEYLPELPSEELVAADDDDDVDVDEAEAAAPRWAESLNAGGEA